MRSHTRLTEVLSTLLNPYDAAMIVQPSDALGRTWLYVEHAKEPAPAETLREIVEHSEKFFEHRGKL